MQIDLFEQGSPQQQVTHLTQFGILLKYLQQSQEKTCNLGAREATKHDCSARQEIERCTTVHTVPIDETAQNRGFPKKGTRISKIQRKHFLHC